MPSAGSPIASPTPVPSRHPRIGSCDVVWLAFIGELFQQGLIPLTIRLAEAAEDHRLQCRGTAQEPAHSSDRQLRRMIRREAIHTRRDAGESDALQPMLRRESERVRVTRAQQLRLTIAAAVPDRTDGVYHMPGLELVALGDLRLARLATVQAHALAHQIGTGSPVNHAIHAASTHERGVGRIDDGIDIKLGDIAFEDLEVGGHCFLVCVVWVVPSHSGNRSRLSTGSPLVMTAAMAVRSSGLG